jgi:uncharacterized membrane protein
MRILGILLTLVGAVLLIMSVFTYTKKQKVVDLGPLQVSVEKKQPTDWMPYSGGVLFIGGIVLVLASKKNR